MNPRHFPNSSQLLALAIAAGAIMRKHYHLGMPHDTKDDQTPVTIADREINAMVIAWFKLHYPHISVIGEEEQHLVRDSKYVAVLDPIDGTHPFTHGLPISTFVLCILHNHKPLAAVIYDPFQNNAWWADANDLCYGNGIRMAVSARDTFKGANAMVIGPAKPRYNIDGIVADLRRQGCKWTRVSSSCLFAGYVAHGVFDIVIAEGTKIWETAAMDLIVTKAGGKACHLDGTPLDYSRDLQGHIITNAALHDKVVELVQKYRP